MEMGFMLGIIGLTALFILVYLIIILLRGDNNDEYSDPDDIVLCRSHCTGHTAGQVHRKGYEWRKDSSDQASFSRGKWNL